MDAFLIFCYALCYYVKVHYKLSCLSFSYPFQSFCQEYPEYRAYITPLFFTDDWLNLYLDNYRMHDDLDADRVSNDISCSDYRFVYMGAKGSSIDATISSVVGYIIEL